MKWVILETPYDDNQIPADKFNEEGCKKLVAKYAQSLTELRHDPDTIRSYVRVYYWDDNTDEEEDIEGLSWFATEDSSERMD